MACNFILSKDLIQLLFLDTYFCILLTYLSFFLFIYPLPLVIVWKWISGYLKYDWTNALDSSVRMDWSSRIVCPLCWMAFSYLSPALYFWLSYSRKLYFVIDYYCTHFVLELQFFLQIDAMIADGCTSFS